MMLFRCLRLFQNFWPTSRQPFISTYYFESLFTFNLDQNDEGTNLNRSPKRKTVEQKVTRSKKKRNTIISRSNVNQKVVTVTSEKPADDQAQNSINQAEKSSSRNPRTTDATIPPTKNPKNLKSPPEKRKLPSPSLPKRRKKKFKNDQVPRKRARKRIKKVVNSRKSTRK